NLAQYEVLAEQAPSHWCAGGVRRPRTAVYGVRQLGLKDFPDFATVAATLCHLGEPKTLGLVACENGQTRCTRPVSGNGSQERTADASRLPAFLWRIHCAIGRRSDRHSFRDTRCRLEIRPTGRRVSTSNAKSCAVSATMGCSDAALLHHGPLRGWRDRGAP